MGLDKFRSCSAGGKITVLTDQRAFEHWATEVLGTVSAPVGRRGRWHELLSQFDLEVLYVKGRNNIVPDILSRWPYPKGGVEDGGEPTIHGSAEDTREYEVSREEGAGLGEGCPRQGKGPLGWG